MTPPYDPATAYHEAGHAVLAMVLGRQVHSVTILPSRDTLGMCEFRKSTYRPSDDWIENEILIALGGVAAEARHTGVHDWGPAARDWQYVYKLAAERAGERRAERLAIRLLSKAEHLLFKESHWRAVELIAQALLKNGEISGRAVRHFFEQANEDD